MVPRIRIESLLASLTEKQFDHVAVKLATAGIADDLIGDEIDDDTASQVAHAVEEALGDD